MHRVRMLTGYATLLLVFLIPHFALDASAQESPQTGTGDPVEIVSLTSGQGKPVALDATGRFAAILDGAAAELWDIKKGRRVRTFATPDIRLASALAMTADGSRIAVGGDGKAIVVWETRTGRIVATPASPIGLVETLAFSKDGRRLVYGGKAKIDIFKRIPAMVIQEIETGRIIKTVESTAFGTLATAYSPARDLVAVGGELSGAILILDIDGRVLRTWSAHKSAVYRLAFSPDGTKLASTELQSSVVHVWEVPEGRLLRTLSAHPSKWGVGSLSWSPDGTSLATLDSDNLRIWNANSGAMVASKPQTDYVQEIVINTVAFAPDGVSLLADGVSTILDARSLELKSRFGVIQYADLSVVVPQVMGESKVIFDKSNVDRHLSLWWLDLASGATQNLFSDSVAKGGHFSKASNDGRHIVGASGEEVLYIDPSNTPPLKSLRSEGFHVGALSANGQVIALHQFALDKDKSIRIVDARSATVVRVLKHARSFSHDPVLSPDGQTIAVVETGDSRPTLNLWKGATGRKTHVRIDEGTNTKPLAFAPDGRSLLIGGTSLYAYSVEHWSVAGPKLLARLHFPGEHERNKADIRYGPFDYVASFHPDGRSAVIADDTVLRLWALDRPRVVRTYRGHTSRIGAVAFAMGGPRIVSKASDGLKVWDTATGELLVTYWITAKGERVAITPEGFFDAAEGGAKMLSVVRGLDAYSIDQVYQSLYRPDLVREKLAGDPKGKVKEAAARLDLRKVLASGAAPRVAIASPAGQAKTDTDEIAVTVAITDQGGGIGRIEWRVNGVTLGLEERGLTRIEGADAKAPQVVRRTLSLEPGQNKIEVVAYNAKNLIASEPASVTVTWDGEVSVTPPKLHVLAVGVNEYWDSRLRLAYAVRDAKALGEALAKAGAGLYGEGRVKITTLTDGEVTTAGLDKAFAQTAKEVQPRDTFALFVAGHGKTLNGRYYFLPYDFRYAGDESIEKTGIDQDRLQAWLAQVRARKTVLLFDTCESGSLTGDRLAVRGLERVAALEKLTRAMGRTVISASSDDGPALEGYKGHGAFTYVLLEALGAGDINKNGLIEVGEIADYLEAKLPDLTFEAFKLRQVPHRKMVGNNFALAGVASLPTAVQTAPKATRTARPTTHVATMAASVREAASADAAVVAELSPGMQVALIEATGGWALIERDGKRLGYVEEKALVRLH